MTSCHTCSTLAHMYLPVNWNASNIDDTLRSMSKKGMLIDLGEVLEDEAKLYRSTVIHGWGFHYQCKECHARLVLAIEDHAFRGAFDRYKLVKILFIERYKKIGWLD